MLAVHLLHSKIEPVDTMQQHKNARLWNALVFASKFDCFFLLSVANRSGKLTSLVDIKNFI